MSSKEVARLRADVEELSAGWAVAREALEQIALIAEGQATLDDDKAFALILPLAEFALSSSLPFQVRRIRAMEKVVENAREYFRTRDFGLTPEESNSPNHFELANRLGEMNFQAEMNARKSLSDLDAIERGEEK